MENENKLMTTIELSKYLNVNPATIKGWVKKRKIPYIKMVGGFRYILSDINDWLKQQSFQTEK